MCNLFSFNKIKVMVTEKEEKSISLNNKPGVTYSPLKKVSSAQFGFTFEFGKGSGVSHIAINTKPTI
jgi:hypothetical protein